MRDDEAKDLANLEDFAGKSVGGITGTTVIPELKKVPGITEIRLFDTFDTCLRDVMQGRVDYAIMDGPIVDYMILNKIGSGVRQVPLAVNNPAFPVLSTKQQTVFGMNGQNTDLFDAVNAGVEWLWTSSRNAELLAKYGLSSPAYIQAPPQNIRQGVDRDDQGNVIGPFAHDVRDFSGLFQG